MLQQKLQSHSLVLNIQVCNRCVEVRICQHYRTYFFKEIEFAETDLSISGKQDNFQFNSKYLTDFTIGMCTKFIQMERAFLQFCNLENCIVKVSVHEKMIPLLFAQPLSRLTDSCQICCPRVMLVQGMNIVRIYTLSVILLMTD